MNLELIKNNSTTLILKQFDIELIKFRYINEGILGEKIEVLKVSKTHIHLLPIGLELNSSSILSWLKRRIIPKNREHVDILLSNLGLSHGDTIGIIKICKGLSLIDSYWVVEEEFDGNFSKYNLFENKFEKTLSLLAYTGYGSIKAKGFTSSPEFTTNGMLKKGWRFIDDKITLFKGGTSGAANTGKEPFSEYYASQIAEVLEINHVKYDLAYWKKNLCSTCELFTNKNTSFVQIYDFVKSMNIYEVGLFLKSLNEEFYNEFVEMLIFDSIILNEDRHYGNFGLLVDNSTNKPIKFAPLFDHGMSLFNFAMDSDYKELEKYSKTRMSYYNINFDDIINTYIVDFDKNKLRKLINFSFKKHKNYNIKNINLKYIEQFIQKRVSYLINKNS